MKMCLLNKGKRSKKQPNKWLREDKIFLSPGSLAIIAEYGLRPMALRPTLSSGLPLTG
ncbi:MAG: hypothetical protein PWP65_1504 [Clostridia bacterium]|nr:hypothetical protein [Clostridia bacterium]